MTRTLVMDKKTTTAILSRLARDDGADADVLYMRLTGAWGFKPQRERVSLAASPSDIAVLRRLGVRASALDPSVLQSGWLVKYRHPRKDVEVTLRTKDRPPKTRTFKTSKGKLKLVRVAVKRISPKEANNHMATKTKRKRKDEEELDELEELEGLEDLDDDDLDDEDDEPDDEDEDDEDEEPAPRKRGKASTSKSKSTRSRKRKAEPEDEEDDDEDDEDEPPARKKGKTRQSSAKTKAKSSTSKSKAKRQPPTPRELPAGKYSPADIAEMAGVDARAVRVFLRANEDEFPKDEESFRYAFNKKDATRIAKRLKANRE